MGQGMREFQFSLYMIICSTYRLVLVTPFFEYNFEYKHKQ